ncbi:MAG: hypothetical protein ACK41D_05340 [Rubricoccaceae bacterium]
MDLALAYPPALLVASGLAAAAFAWWSYGRMQPRVGRARRAGLATLRFAALFAVLLLLFEPAWTRLTRTAEPPLLVLLVDTSESVTLGDGPPSRRVVDALRALPDDPALRLYAFDTDARPARRDSLAFTGERTDISGALERVEQDFAGRNLRAVILVTDGRFNAGRNPAYLAERFAVPIHAVPAGDSLSARDVRAVRVVTNEVAYTGAELPFRLAVRATGFAGQATRVTLSQGGRVLASAPLTLPPDGVEAEVELAAVPTAPGPARFTLSVTPLTGEATTRNNTLTADVRVLEDRRRVLVVAAAPGPDLPALRAALEADRSLDVTLRTQRAPGTFYEGPLPDDLGRFDLLVLAGYPGRAADEPTAARLAAAAARGLPVLFVLSAQTNLTALGRLFGEALPVMPALPRPSLAEATAAPTATGRAHPVLEGAGVSPDALARLPPVLASETRWALQPGAQTLLAVRRGGQTLEAPLLVVRQDGTRRAAALLGAGTWRWQALPEDLADLGAAYSSLVSALVRWTTSRQDRRPVRVRADRALFGERERVTFSGQVYDENLRPLDGAEIRLSVRGPAGRAQTLAMRAVGAGRFVADAGPLPPGAYTFTAEATRDGARLGEDRGTFGVGRLAAEFQEPGTDLPLLRQVAARSGGALVPLDSLPAFVRGLRADGRLEPRLTEQRAETPLLHLPWLLGLVVLLLAAEWVLRKRSGMV